MTGKCHLLAKISNFCIATFSALNHQVLRQLPCVMVEPLLRLMAIGRTPRARRAKHRSIDIGGVGINVFCPTIFSFEHRLVHPPPLRPNCKNPNFSTNFRNIFQKTSREFACLHTNPKHFPVFQKNSKHFPQNYPLETKLQNPTK